MNMQDKLKRSRFLVGSGAVILALGIALRRIGSSLFPHLSDEITAGLSSVLFGLSAVLLVMGFIRSFKETRTLDERFILHRLKATRLAAIVGLVLLLVWQCYDAFANDVIRWEILVILGAMAITKVGAMLYYRHSD